MNIEVCFTPEDFHAEKFKDCTAVVIDVLRATTSIATAFHNGCSQIVPVETVEEAFEKKEKIYPKAILAGERKGVLISGFHLGNSPLEYSNGNIGSKTVIMTTTNGTVALNKAAGVNKVLTAAFVNAMAVCSQLKEDGQDIVILCAGTDGRFSVEDTLCAGLIVERLSSHAQLSDKALAVQAMYQGFSSNLVERVAQSSHALYLIHLGFTDDVRLCLEQDVFSVVPEFKNGVLEV